MTPAELSQRSGISRAQLSRLELGRRRFTLDQADKIAAAMQVPRSHVTDISQRVDRTTVTGPLQAGRWVADPGWEDDSDTFEVATPEVDLFNSIERHASQVKGALMNKVYPDGTILVWVPYGKIKEPLVPGRRYIIDRHSGDGLTERTVKTFGHSDGKPFFYPESNDPSIQEPLDLEAQDDAPTIEVVGRIITSIRNE